MFYWPRSVENRAAIRTSLAALIAVLISFKFHLQTPYWSGMSVVIVANLYTGSIIDKAMMRIIGTVAGAFLGLYIAQCVANSFILYLVACFIIVSISVYFYNLSTYGYAYLLGALCAFIIISQIALAPQNAFFVAIWRPVEIAIGVIVSAISAYVIFPNHLKENINGQVKGIFSDFSHEFEQLLGSLTQKELPFAELEVIHVTIKKKLYKATELISAMNRELGVTQAEVDVLRALLDSLFNLSRQLQILIITPLQQSDLVVINSLPIDSVLKAVQSDLSSLQLAFANPKHNSLVNLKTEGVINHLDNILKAKQMVYLGQSKFVYAFVFFLEQVNQHITLMGALLTKGAMPNNSKFKIITKQQRLRFDPDLMKHSFKAGIAVILALLFWLITNWPGGLNGIISSLVISIRKNLYEMKHTSIHRLFGCFLGGGVALLTLHLIEMNLFDFVVVVFFSVWAFSYFMFKWPKYAYIGLQANIALIISLAQEGGPLVLIDPPLQRLGGIVIGIVASFLVANIIWRADTWTILERYLNKINKYTTFNLNQLLANSNEIKTLYHLSSLFWLSRGLLETLEGEHLNVIKQQRHIELKKKFEFLVIIQAIISSMSLTIDIKKAEETAALFGLDLLLYEKKLMRFYEAHDFESGCELSSEINGFLTQSANLSSVVPVENKELKNLIAYLNALNQLACRIV
ncbi:MAG: FUSC family protein [bacterium]|nr:FUSC family protein [bacterium]